MKLTREKLRRMFDQNTGQVILGGGGGDVDLTGIATEAWVEENYLSKAFFARLFKAYGPAETEGDPDVEVEPNDLESNITSIEAMFGFWTQQYISALGQGSGGGGGGGGSDTLADLIDVELTNPVSGQVLKYNGTKWINSAASTGTVTRVAMSVPTGFAVTGSPITVSGVISLSFADGYSLPTTAKQTNWDAAYSWTSVSRTTLADYGITDAKFGTPGTDSIPITLGSTTQSVLTQHQSLANYYTKSETDGKFLTISFFRSLFRAYTSSNAEVQPNDGSTSTIASIKAMFGFWTEQYLSALGQSSGGGGGVTLNQPLQGINQAGLSAPTTAGQILVYNGTKWAYAGNISITNLTAYAGTFNSGVSAVGSFTSQGGNFIAQNGGYIIQGADNSYVLLAGGDKSKLKTVNGYSLFGEGNIDASGGGTGNYLPLAGGILNNYNTGWIFGATTSSSNAHASAYLAYSGGYGMWVGVSTTDTSHYLAEFRKGTTGFGAGGSTVFYIRADGKIGVNTSSPEYDFDIRGGLYVKTAKAIIDETTNGIQIKTVANTMIAALRGGASTPVAGGEYGIFQLYHGDVEKIRMYATGDSWITESLGIGTTTPSYKLHVAGTIGTSGQITSTLATGTSPLSVTSTTMCANLNADLLDGQHGSYYATASSLGNYLPLTGGTLYTTTTASWIFGATTSSSNAHASAYLAYSGGYGMWVGVSTTDTSHYLAEFRKGTTGFGAGGSTVFYIRADGKIGVNTSSPEYDFDIRGGLYVKTAKAIIDETTNGIQIKTVANTMIAALRGGASTPVAGGEYGIFQLYHGDVEKIRMYATGDSWITESLGIGTTSPAYKLDVRGDVAVGTPGTSGIIGCAYADNNNNFYNYIKFNSGSGGMQYYGGKFASGTSTVAHQFFTTSNDPALTIINSTYVGIGTTSPSHKLHVNGSVRIGDAVLVWDSTNGALKVQKSDGTAASFYATGAVSALGQSSSGTTYLDQATADGRYLKLSGGQTMTGSFSGTSITLSSQMKSTNAVATAYLTVGTSSLSTSYTLYVNGNAGINHIVIGNEQQVNTVNCAVIQTLSSRGIYIKSGSAPNYVDGTWANASDIRLKDIVSNAGASVEQVANAPVFNYKWKAGGTQVMLGTSAQYWKNVFNFGVSEGPDSYLYMDYASIALASAVMVARKVQSHEERIAALEALSNRQGKEIVSLRAENERLINEINELKTA